MEPAARSARLILALAIWLLNSSLLPWKTTSTHFVKTHVLENTHDNYTTVEITGVKIQLNLTVIASDAVTPQRKVMKKAMLTMTIVLVLSPNLAY